MKIKEGASLQGLDLRMRRALRTADLIWKDNGQELVITSGTDSAHSAGSLHYYGLAIDCRTRYFDQPELAAVVTDLREELSDSYDVIVHSSHIHIELKDFKPLLESNYQ